VFREQIRMEVAKRFAAGEDSAVVAKALRVHVRSVQRWRAAWDNGGEAGLVSKGPLTHAQLCKSSSRCWRPNWNEILPRTAGRTASGG
jgi:transposase